MTDEQLYNLIVERIQAAGSQKACAEEWGISEAYLSDILHDRRAPGPTVLEALGLRRVNHYEKAETQEQTR